MLSGCHLREDSEDLKTLIFGLSSISTTWMMDSVDGPFRLQQIGLSGISTFSTLDSIAGTFGLEQLGLCGVSTSSTMDSIAGAFGLVQVLTFSFSDW